MRKIGKYAVDSPDALTFKVVRPLYLPAYMVSEVSSKMYPHGKKRPSSAVTVGVVLYVKKSPFAVTG